MRKHFIVLVLAVLEVAALFTAAFGDANGNAADRSLHGSSRVNPSTLGMEMQIPLGGYPGRGINMSINLSYSSKVWRIEQTGYSPMTNQAGCPSTNIGIYSENSASGWTNSLQSPYIEYPETIFRDNGTLFSIYDDCPYLSNPGPQPSYQNAYVRKIVLHLPSGETHELRMNDTVTTYPTQSPMPENWSGWYYAVDGSNLKYYEDRVNNSYYLLLPDGSRYDFTTARVAYQQASIRPATKITDRNGNFSTYYAPGSTDENGVTYPNGYWKDTLGRNIAVPFQPDAPSSPTTAQNPQIYTMPGITGNYKFHWKRLKADTAAESALTDFTQALNYIGSVYWTMSPDSHLDVHTPSLFNSTSGRQTGDALIYGVDLFNPIVLTEIDLPTGARYKFSYDVYGQIDKIYYPTGGAETFQYEKIPALAVIGRLDRHIDGNLGVTKRQVFETADTGTPVEWTYKAEYTYPSSYKVTATNPDLTKNVRFIRVGTPPGQTFPPSGTFGYDDGLAGMVYDEQTLSAGGLLLSEKLTNWIKTTLPVTAPSGISVGADWHPRIDSEETRTCDASGVCLSATTKFEYDGDLTHRDAAVNVKTVNEYGFTTSMGSLGALQKSVGTTYLINDQTIPQSTRDVYNNQNMVALPTVITVTDMTNAIAAQNKISYDEGGYSPNVGRGNATTNQTWDSTKGAATDPNAYVLTHAKFDAYGNQIEATDAKGDVTATEYSSTYNYAFPTKVTSAVPDPNPSQNPDGLSHGSNAAFFTTTTYDYDVTTHQGIGLPLTTTDANGQTTRMSYTDPTTGVVDPLLRIRKITAPNGQQTITEYDNQQSRWVKVKTQLDDTNWKIATAYSNGLGQPIKNELVDSNGNIITETEYDNMGRVKRATNPYRPGEQKLWSVTNYDDLGRVKQTFAPAPDGQTGASLGTIQYSVSTAANAVGTVVTTTDAAGKKSRAIKNSMDQLVRVDEATGSNDLGDIAAPNQATYYSYNTLGKMVKVQQGSQYRYFLHDSMGRLLKVRQPEQDVNSALNTTGNPDNNSWTAGFTYDNNGNALTATDAKNVTITNTYDNLNRVRTRSYSDSTPPVSYFYDGVYYDANNVKQQAAGGAKGALTQVKNAVSTSQTIAFDSFGKALTYQQITDGQTYTSQYQYKLTGGLAQETYPSGRVMKYETNADGNLSRVTGQVNASSPVNTYANSFLYTASGATGQLKLGNGKWETAQYNERLQVTQLGLGNSATDASLWKVNYDYGEIDASGNLIAANNNGNIAKQTISFAGLVQPFVQTYKYDAVNRLTEAKETNNAQRTWQQNWTYDRYGNRTSHVKFIGDTQINLDNKTNPTIDASRNRIAAGQSYQYDSGGNVIQDADGLQFIFNGDNKQTQVKDASNNVIGLYYYDGDGKRIKKVTNLETTVFVYSGGKLVAEYSTQVSQTPKISYTTTDTLGSPRVITDQFGTVVSRRDFMPFGEDLFVDATYRTTALKYGYGDSIRQKFTGYQKDDETQLDFAEARYYNSQHGRFTAIDPLLASGKSANPQTFNRYVYVMNNPLNSTDPSGMLPVYHRVYNGMDQYTTDDHSDGKGGWEVFKDDIRFEANDGNTYHIDGNGITLVGNTNFLNRLAAVSAGIPAECADSYHCTGLSPGFDAQAAGRGFMATGGVFYNAFVSLLTPEGEAPPLQMYEPNGTGERGIYWTTTGLLLISGIREVGTAGEMGTVSEATSAIETTGAVDEATPVIKQGSSGGSTAFQKFGLDVRKEALAENPTKTCVFCRQQGSQLDHAIPRSWGGNATIENAQWACSFCNASKGNRGLYPLNPAPGYEGPFPPPWWKK